jgi:hypothetical protein
MSMSAGLGVAALIYFGGLGRGGRGQPATGICMAQAGFLR